MIYSIAEISKLLSERAEAVCRQLLPTGKRQGRIWEVGGVNGETGKSLKVNLEGEHAGTWKDWADEDFRGDLVDLWEKTKGQPKLEAIASIKGFLGITDPANASAKRYALPTPKKSIVTVKPLSPVESYLVLERKLSEETIQAFGVKSDGKNIVYESWGPTGKLLNRCYVSLTRDQNGKKRVMQEAKCAPSLFGWQALPKEAFDQRKVLICEGQIDAMTWHQWGIPALSVPNGSGLTWIEYEWENLECFETIFLSFDMDGKTDGPLQKAVQRLGLHRCRIVNLPYKDANDCLKAGCTQENAQEWLEQAQWPKCKGVVEAREYYHETIEEFFPTEEKKKQATRIQFLQRKDGGIEFFPGDVSIWTGVSSHGKTTFLNFLMAILVAQYGVFICSMEMRPQKLIARIFKSTLIKPFLTMQEIDDCFANMDGRLLFVPCLGSITQADLFEAMEFSFARYGCSHFLIDSLMKIDGLEEKHPEQLEFMNQLQRFAKGKNVHVHLVAHPRKIEESGRAGKMDVKGSSVLPNNADNVYGIRRNIEKIEISKERPLTDEENMKMWDAMISSEKQRESGWQGGFYLRFDPATYRYSTFHP